MTSPRLALYAFRSSAPKQWDLTKFVNAIKDASGCAGCDSLFTGVQMSLSDIIQQHHEEETTIEEFHDVIRRNNLRLIVDLDGNFDASSSEKHNNDVLRKPPLEYLKSFEMQLNQISHRLGDIVSHINFYNSGDHRWDDITTSIEYLSDVLAMSAQFLEDHPNIGKNGRETDIMGGTPNHLIGISHQTCGKGVFNTPEKTRQLLEILPPVRLTSDISNWSNHRWESTTRHEESDDRDSSSSTEFQIEIVPHIDHIHLNYGLNSGNEASFDVMSEVDVLNHVWTRKTFRGVTEISVTPYCDSPKTNSDDDEDLASWNSTIEAAAQIKSKFESWSPPKQV